MEQIKKKPLKNFTIYLVKDNFTESNQIIDSKEQYESETINYNDEVIGELYLKKIDYYLPSWAKIFEGYFDINKIGRGGNPSALLLLKVDERLFAIPFGQGRSFLIQDCWEERFGLKVALNIIDESSIKSLDKKTFDSIAILSREQASKEIKAEDFGLDIEKDLLKAVVGFPKDKLLGERVSGMDSLKIALRIELVDLKKICKQLLNKYYDNKYKEKFPWVDHLTEIKDKTVNDNLDNELVKLINGKYFNRCWTSIPEIIDWEVIDGFKYGLNQRAPMYYDIQLNDFIEERFNGEEITIDKLKNRYVFGVTNEHLERYKWSIYKCLYCEIELENETYLLSGSKWYKIDNGFIKSVNNFYNNLNKSNIELPVYNHSSEKEYNISVSLQSQSLALLDRKLIDPGEGRGNIEFCDLYHKEKILVHVKRYSASSILSHLFMQGLNSGELFQLDKSFREKVNEILPGSHKILNTDERPTFNQYEIVYAIISDSQDDKIELPFFSKLTLRNAFRKLTGLGYKVSIKNIPVDIEKKVRKLPPQKNYK